MFTHHIVAERDRVRFGEDVFRRRGYSIHYVSLWNLLGNEDKPDIETQNFNAIPNLWKPKTQNEFLDFLDTINPNDFVICQVGLWKESVWLHLAMADRGIKYAIMNMGKFPNLQLCRIHSPRHLGRFFSACTQNTIQLAYRIAAQIRLIRMVGPSYLKLAGPVLEIRGGTYQSPFTYVFPFPWRSRKIDVEGFELMWAKKAAGSKSVPVQRKYAVFVDGGITGLPDHIIWDLAYSEDPEPYFAELRKTFDKIERDHGIPIVIALHPKSSYSETEQQAAFGGRPSFINATPELIKSSEFVLMHCSTAVSIAVAFRKPILFLTSKIVRSVADMHAIAYLAGWFEQDLIDMNGDAIDQPRKIPIPTPTERVYGRFMRNFLKADKVDDRQTWDVVLDAFEEMVNRHQVAAK
tara:strand:+ start:10251 stop:11471 length:1221 start_codon:yes stop_codon:yes gene_type:complete